MNTKVVRPEHFERAVLESLAQYGDATNEKVEQVTKDIARQTVRAIKAASPVGNGPKSGSYARGWSHKPEKGGPFRLKETVYNRTDYQLTHLLEEGHITGGGGHYPKKKDHTGIIARIETEYTAKYMEEVMAKI